MNDSDSPKYGRHSIRFKLVTTSVVIQVVLLTLLVWNSTRLANEYLIRQAEGHIQEILPLLNASIAGPLLQEDLATLGELLDHTINAHGLRYIAINSNDGHLLIERGLRSIINATTNKGNISLQQHISSSTPDSPYLIRSPLTLSESIIGYMTLEYDTLSIVNAISAIRKQGASIALAEIILSLLLLTILAINITHNLLTLTKAVATLSPSGKPLKLNINSNDEVGGLSHAFEDMTQKLQLREQERDAAAYASQASDARYKRLVENLSSEYFFYSHDTDGVFFYVSESIIDVLGYTQNDFLTHFSTYLTDNPINDHLKSKKNNGQTKQKRRTFIMSIYHLDGSERMLEVSESPVINDNGKITAMEGIAHDITTRLCEADELREHRDNLEKMVDERTLELKTINNELESFCYSVSHDLRAPLRGINGFSNALIEDYEHTLDETGKDYLDRIKLGTERMSSLIDDLLNLSRITRYKMNIQKVNISALCEEILKALREENPKRSVNVEIEKNLHAYGDKNLLTVALSNLIGNAWKYTGKTEDAAITVSATMKRGHSIYSIADNGAGFNPEYIDKIFLPFQRLHKHSDFPGSGVGLSTVHRVITRHQGKIWAKSELGKGASFHFTLEIK